MAKLMAALEGALEPGIYLLPLAVNREHLEVLCQAADAQFFHLDGQTIRSKAQLLLEMARSLRFPDYFGGTWDALADCLTDLDHQGRKRVILFYTQPENLLDAAPSDGAIALEILQVAIEDWQSEAVQLYVLLQTERDSLGDASVPHFPRLEA